MPVTECWQSHGKFLQKELQAGAPAKTSLRLQRIKHFPERCEELPVFMRCACCPKLCLQSPTTLRHLETRNRCCRRAFAVPRSLPDAVQRISGSEAFCGAQRDDTTKEKTLAREQRQELYHNFRKHHPKNQRNILEEKVRSGGHYDLDPTGAPFASNHLALLHRDPCIQNNVSGLTRTNSNFHEVFETAISHKR